jgi:hypothetical protein
MTLNTPDMKAKLFPRRAGRCLTRVDSHEMMFEALIKSTVQEEWLVEGVRCTTRYKSGIWHQVDRYILRYLVC